MKKLFAVCLLLLYLFPVCACAQTQAEKLMEAYDYDLKVDGGSFEDYTKRVAAGESVFGFSDILRMLTTSIRKDGKDILSLLLKITAVSVLFAVLTNMRTVGVMGDERTYEYLLGLRAVETTDFMTANWAHLPHDLLEKVSSRIVNEVPHINRVVYEITSKPPSTIEWE